MFFSTADSVFSRRPVFSAVQWSNPTWPDRFASTTTPTPEFEETDAGYSLVLDVPGLSKEQLKLEIDQRHVRIESLADAPRSYRASYRLPQMLDAQASSAKLEHGVLTLNLVKQAPAVTAQSVTIN